MLPTVNAQRERFSYQVVPQFKTESTANFQCIVNQARHEEEVKDDRHLAIPIDKRSDILEAMDGEVGQSRSMTVSAKPSSDDHIPKFKDFQLKTESVNELKLLIRAAMQNCRTLEPKRS